MGFYHFVDCVFADVERESESRREALAVERTVRVLHLIPSLVGGGAERQLVYLCEALAGTEAEVHVAYLHEGPNLARLANANVQLHRISGLSNHDPRICLRVIRLIKSLHVDVVQTWLLQMDVFGGAACLATSTPWLLSERSSAPMYSQGWKFRLRRWMGSSATAIIANSQSGIDYWAAILRSPWNTVIPNVVPLREISAREIPEEAAWVKPDRRVVLFVGRYSEEKNLYTALQALDIALAKLTDVDAIFLGEGPLRGELERSRDALEHKARIHILGYSTEVWGWLKRSSLYVSLSRFEGSPNTVLEAAACGCPVVLSDIEAHREVVAYLPNAILVPASEPAAIADAVFRGLSLGVHARSTADSAPLALAHLTPEATARRYLEIYRKVLADA
jgi:glycosyltransferase involved in cell wall biosynthesis